LPEIDSTFIVIRYFFFVLSLFRFAGNPVATQEHIAFVVVEQPYLQQKSNMSRGRPARLGTKQR